MGRLGKFRSFALLAGLVVWVHLGAAGPAGFFSPTKRSTCVGNRLGQEAPIRCEATAPIPDSTKLEPIKTEKPVYPLEAEEKELQGQVWVKIRVSETGDVASAEAISGDPVFVKSALDAVKKWKFKPFIKNGVPTAVATKLPFSFVFTGNVHQEKLPPAAEANPANAASSGGNAASQDAKTATPPGLPVSSGSLWACLSTG